MCRLIPIFLFVCFCSYGYGYSPRNEIFAGKFNDVEYSTLIPAIPGLSLDVQEREGWLVGYQFTTSEPVSGLNALLGTNLLSYEDPNRSSTMLSGYAAFRLWLGRFLFINPYIEGSIKGPTLFYDKEGGVQAGFYQDYAAIGCAIGSTQILGVSVRLYRYYENKEEMLYTTPYIFSASLCF